MSFDNFYVVEKAITKEFKGCYTQVLPSPDSVGTLSGQWIPKPITNIKPVRHELIPNLWIYCGFDGAYYKMVGLEYGNGSPKRVDGRAMSVKSDIGSELNTMIVTPFWDNASIKNITEQEYTLTISNNSPMKSLNTCLRDANNNNNSTFTINNFNSNKQGNCNSSGEPLGFKMNNVSEEQCLKTPYVSTVYNVKKAPNDGVTLGKTYLGVKKDKSDDMTFHEYPSSLLSVSKNYKKFSGYDSNGGDLSNGVIKDSSSENCKQYCLNKGNQCKGFVYNNSNNTCFLKDKIYPNVSREINKSADIYTRMPKVKNSLLCPKGVKAVDTDFIYKNGGISSDKMSLDFQCETEAAIKEEEGIEKAYSTLTDEISDLREENDRILKGFDNVRDDIKKKSKHYESTNRKIEKHKTNPTVEKLLLDSEQLQSVFSMRNTGLVLALLLLSIFLVRVLRK